MNRGSKIALFAAVGALIGLGVTKLLPTPLGGPGVDLVRAEEAEDFARLKQIAMYSALRLELPLTKGGQLDVYRIVLEADPDERAVVDLCFSARARSGPTIEQIKKGDYRQFAYARASGELKHRGGDNKTLLLWDPSPQPLDRRLVVLDRGGCKSIAEDEFAAFLKKHEPPLAR